MWLLFAILTVLFWGTSETIFKRSSKQDEHSVVHLLAYNGIFFGISGIIYMLLVYQGFSFDFTNLLKYLPIATVYILSMFSYYQAMARVKISIISPIVNSSCIITVILAVLFLKQYPSIIQAIAIVAIVFSLLMLSVNKTPEDDTEKKGKSPAKWIYIVGLIFAFGYFILDGLASFLDELSLEGYMQEEDMLIAYSFIYLMVGVFCYCYLKIKDKTYKFQLDKLKLGGSLLETIRAIYFYLCLRSRTCKYCLSICCFL